MNAGLTMGTTARATVAPASNGQTRPIIIHYHLFKNAGSSFDQTLKANLGAAWTTHEIRGAHFSPTEVASYLIENPAVSALSSHTALLPPPVIPGAHVIPVLFVRHPIDRVRSLYDFGRTQGADTPGSRLAKQMGLREYIDWRLSRREETGDRVIADFQTHRLSPAGDGTTELGRALDAIARLPFVGLVEQYGRSLERLQALLAPHFPGINLAPVRLNSTSRIPVPLAARLLQFRVRVGMRRYGRLVAANRNDLELWRTVRRTYSR
jgi:hypothetical protein